MVIAEGGSTTSGRRGEAFMIKRYALSLLAAVAITSWATAGAEAQDTKGQYYATNTKGDLVVKDDLAGFGKPRQWVFSTDAGLSISRTTVSNSDNAAITTLVLQPAADYFIIDNLSVGGAVGLTYQKVGHNSGTKFTIGPRVGYNFELSKLLSVWPKLGFSYSHTNQEAGDQANALALNLFAPVLLHPAPHFFAGLGPFLDADLSGDTRATTWGIKLTIGGWIQG
jgi:hypothetical protein